MTIDEKVKDYLERASKIANAFADYIVGFEDVVATASLLQQEDHFQGKKSKRNKKDPDISFNYETKEWTISDEYVKILQDLYKKDLKEEFKKMTGWLLSHPHKKDFKRFVDHWLSGGKYR